jgi:hypothetical protein
MAGPSMGLGAIGPGGMPRIKFNAGDFDPKKIMTAVMSGQGFDAPRKMGIMMVVTAVGVTILNMLLIFLIHRYYPYLYSVGSIIGWTGLWLAITGQPHSNPDGSKAPMWTRIGLAAAFGIGMISAASLIIF